MNQALPCRDFFEWVELDDEIQVAELLETLCCEIEEHYFQAWALVERYEQQQPLSEGEQQQIDIWLEDNADTPGQIQEIGGQPRPCQSWHVIANKILPLTIAHPYPLYDAYEYWGIFEGWQTLREIINHHGEDLPLPEQAQNPLQVIEPKLLHTLNLQICFGELAGLGERYSLLEGEDNEEGFERVEWFINALRQFETSVAYLQISLDSLLDEYLDGPEDELAKLRECLQQSLSISDAQAPLTDYL